MANQLVTPTWVLYETTRMLVNSLKFAANVDRSYSDEFVQGGAKVGLTVNARLPQRYQVNKGAALTIQDAVNQIVPITLTDQANIGIDFSSLELATQVDDYKKRYIMPAVNAIVTTIDFDGLSRMYKETYTTVGTPGVPPGSTGTLPQAATQPYLDAGVKLDGAACPTPRTAILSSYMHMYLTSGTSTIFNPAATISKQYKAGKFGDEALGIDEWFWSQNVATHTVGALGGTPLANSAAVQTGASILIDGCTASVTGYFLEGDVIQFAGVYAVNPLNYQTLTYLQDFVVTADVDSDGSGEATVPISPSIVTAGALQNVSAGVANNAAVTTFGHASTYAGDLTPQALVWNEGAYAMVMVDLPLPGGCWVAERVSNKELGVALRLVKQYDVMSDQAPPRVDGMYGWKAVRPDMGSRVCG